MTLITLRVKRRFGVQSTLIKTETFGTGTYYPPREGDSLVLRRFGLKTGIHFTHHFGLESGIVFEGTTGVCELIYRFYSK